MDLDDFKLRQLCRVCATETGTRLDLFDAYQNGVVLAEMLSTCIQMQIVQSDVLPSNICLNCTDRLYLAYEFCHLAKANEVKLQGMISASIHGPVAEKFECHEINDSEMSVAHNVIDVFGPAPDAIKVEPMETVEATTHDPLGSMEPVPRIEPEQLLVPLIPPRARTTKVTRAPPVKPSTAKSTQATKKQSQKESPKQFECYLCKAPSNSFADARKHLRLHKPPKHDKNIPRKMNRRQTWLTQVECYLCKMEFASYDEGLLHFRLHNEATPHVCQVCGMRYSLQGLAHHLCLGQSIQCDYCPAIFHATVDLLKHLDDHKKQYKLHKCTECPRKFAMASLRDMHKGQHNNMDKMIACATCGSRFKAIQFLNEHLLTHSNEKSHLCTTCGMKFKKEKSLKRHALRHSSFRPFACPKCPSRFYENFDLQKHMDVHSDIKYVCVVCEASLNSRRSLEEHTRRIHKLGRDIACDLCSLKFSTPATLKKHYRTHTGEKPHKCRHCELAFAQTGDLNKHLRLHVGENTYQCDICEQRFRLHMDLRHHLFEHYQNGQQGKSTNDVAPVDGSSLI